MERKNDCRGWWGKMIWLGRGLVARGGWVDGGLGTSKELEPCGVGKSRAFPPPTHTHGGLGTECKSQQINQRTDLIKICLGGVGLT